jgi:hypothetical protein
MVCERDHEDGANIIRDEHTQELDTRITLKSNVSELSVYRVCRWFKNVTFPVPGGLSTTLTTELILD